MSRWSGILLFNSRGSLRMLPG